MRAANKKTTILLIGLVCALVLPGCTNWKQKYNICTVELSSCEGQLARESEHKGELAEDLAQSRQEIEELRRQIEEQKRSPADATGFEGLDVAFDSTAGTITVTLPNTILFNSGKAELKKTTSAELNQIQSVLRSKYPGKQIDVVGHTDSEPIKFSGWRDNWQLSSERALSVVDYLIKRGIPPDEIRAVGCGPARPIADNSTAQGKARNRRVEIVVYMR